MSKKAKHYIQSSIITFLTGFCLVLIADWNTITLSAFRDGALMGLLFSAIRAGIKAVIEGFLSWQSVK
jgi:hypothetical protein